MDAAVKVVALAAALELESSEPFTLDSVTVEGIEVCEHVWWWWWCCCRKRWTNQRRDNNNEATTTTGTDNNNVPRNHLH